MYAGRTSCNESCSLIELHQADLSDSVANCQLVVHEDGGGLKRSPTVHFLKQVLVESVVLPGTREESVEEGRCHLSDKSPWTVKSWLNSFKADLKVPSTTQPLASDIASAFLAVPRGKIFGSV